MKHRTGPPPPSAPGPRSKGFPLMAAAYFLGVFNDNYFKQAVFLLAVAAGKPEWQGYALAVFTVPFLLFAAPAGWVADRFPKRSAIVMAKTGELAAVLAGFAALILGVWPMVFAALALMGTQATVFSPALNGSIPDFFPDERVPAVNGVLRMLVTAAILGGIALAGLVLDVGGAGPFGVPAGLFFAAVIGAFAAVVGLSMTPFIQRVPAAAPGTPFPRRGPLDTLRELAAVWRDPALAAAVVADVFIWSAGSVQVLVINTMGLEQFQLSKTATSGLLVAQMAGIGAGGLLAGKLSAGRPWSRFPGPAGVGMGLTMAAVGLTPWMWPGATVPLLFALVGVTGFFGGMALIPVESFIQIRPPAHRKGAVLSAANFAAFAGIMLSGPFGNLLNSVFRPTTAFAFAGALSVLFASVFILYERGKKWA